MHRKFLLTVVGEDRPGIVNRLTEVLVKHDANLEESRMAILGGEFAAVVLVTAREESIGLLKDSLNALQNDGIAVTVKETAAVSADRFAGHSYHRLTLTGADREGIVYKVSQLLRDHSINIQDMETDVVPAPETGIPLFRMKSTIAVPKNIHLSSLLSQLSRVGEEEGVDIEVIATEPDKSKAVTTKV